MATTMCPLRLCTETGVHGHGTEMTYLPRRRGSSAGVKMEVCPHGECGLLVEHCHPDETQPSGYSPYYLPKPLPVCTEELCTLMVRHGHGILGEFEPKERCRVLPGCQFPHVHLHGMANGHDGTMAPPSEPYSKVLAFAADMSGWRHGMAKDTYTLTDGRNPVWVGPLGRTYLWEALVEPERWRDVNYDMPDFVEDTDSVRGPGWGVRYCPHCDHVTFGGLESSTKEAMYEHFETCEVLHPPVPEPVTAPDPGTFDAALYAAFCEGRISDGFEPPAEEFRLWRAQWHGEWETT